MAKLVIICEVETTDEYDLEAMENSRLRQRHDADIPTTADELGKQVARVLSGLRYIDGKKDMEVKITTAVGSQSRKDARQAVPTVINDVPSEKRKAG